MVKGEYENVINSLSPAEHKILPFIKSEMVLGEILAISGAKEIEAMRALQWLQNKSLVSLEPETKKIVSLGKNGIKYREKGLPEKRFLNEISEKIQVSHVAQNAGLEKDEVNICIGILKKEGLIEIEKAGGLLASITQKGKMQKKTQTPEERFLSKEFPFYLDCLGNEERKICSDLLKRKEIIRVEEEKVWHIKLTKKGREIQKLAGNAKPLIEKITPADIKTCAFENKEFRRYDVSANVPEISGGRIHFVEQAIRYIKKIWLELGFKEMSGNIVQTSFWDLDALFVPQDHPARDMQDTFYIKEPNKGRLPNSIAAKVRAVHENGADTKSKGWQYKWSPVIAKENLLRTHTTVLSAQTISKLKKSDLPAKFFSVGRVYRNEALSWKHLFEFVQVEGIVVDPNANFKNLKGYLREFFSKMGFSDVRIRPGHFPYTEPSAEVDVWHPKKKIWVELGGSGIFRPEVTKTLLGEEIPVLAWGLGMERTIMEYYNITDIRDLYKNDLKQLREIKTWMR